MNPMNNNCTTSVYVFQIILLQSKWILNISGLYEYKLRNIIFSITKLRTKHNKQRPLLFTNNIRYYGVYYYNVRNMCMCNYRKQNINNNTISRLITEQMPLRQAYFDNKFKTLDLFLISCQFNILFVELKGCYNQFFVRFRECIST